MRLKIFSDRRFLPEGIAHESILNPFWGNALENLALPGASYYEAFEKYLEVGKSFFEMSSLEEADIVVFPGNLEKIFDPRYLKLANKLQEQAMEAGKLTVGFFWGDRSNIQLPISCDLVFRNSLYRSHKNPSDFAYPSWTVDFVDTYFHGNIPIRQKADKPVVGFCGFVGRPNLKLYTKQFLYQMRKLAGKSFPPPHYTGHLLRDKAISLMESSNLLRSNFVLRKHMGFVGQPSRNHKNYRMEYVNNIKESDYIFCCRGYGNYSYRFYEILSSGRIPVFLDTDCVLPYSFEVDWKNYCVWIPQKDLPNIADIIADFHAKLSPQEFVDLQHECYKIWKERLSPEGFFANLYKHLMLMNRGTTSKQEILVTQEYIQSRRG